MSEVDGIELFEQIQADPATQKLPVIFLTANAHILARRLPDYQARGAKLLPKPFRINHLVALVSRELEPDKTA